LATLVPPYGAVDLPDPVRRSGAVRSPERILRRDQGGSGCDSGATVDGKTLKVHPFFLQGTALAAPRVRRVGERSWRTGTDVVRVAVRDRVAVITLHRPERRNALHPEMYEPIRRALAEFADAPDVGCIVLTGAGSAFCAGGDVRDGRARRADGAPLPPDERVARLVADAQVAVDLHEHPRITIAAVNGPAVGAGWALALACDLRIASASARFVAGWARLALSGDFGGAWFLTRLVGPSVALELLASDAALDAEAAAARGLVNRVVPDDEFPAAWFAWARSFADGPQDALAAMKRNVADAVDGGLPLPAAMAAEAARNVACSASADHRAAVRSWLDARSPGR
jgi:2-(1,2-epoxy-1,2-dihydrophenyl)acetyl-CoA isomerase